MGLANQGTERPRLIVIAGCNGAGKTTFAREFLPNEARVERFLNADLIAAGVSPLNPELAARKAARIFLDEFDAMIQGQVRFAIESTLSGKSYLPLFRAAKAAGYELVIHFLFLPDADLAVARVRERVSKGGHHVPERDVRRRFERGVVNFSNLYAPIADLWFVWNNQTSPPGHLADQRSMPPSGLMPLFRRNGLRIP